MDTNLLRSWLGLPPGPWPPDDRTILGLPDGAFDPAAAERMALMLMGQLRPHQLIHPELVTEGMNRLAQALLAVTASASAPPPTATPLPTPPSAGKDLPVAELVERPTPGEVYELEPLTDAVPPADELTPEELRSPELLAAPVAEPVGSQTESRRAAYRELAGLRGLLRAWDRLRPTVADPSVTLATPDQVFQFLDGIQQVKGATIHPGLDPAILSAVAPAVDAVVRQPLPLAVFRSLVRSQRQRLARDWARGRSTLVDHAAALRVGVRQAVPSRSTVTGRGLLSSIMKHPEWVMVAATGLIVAVVVLRTVTQ